MQVVSDIGTVRVAVVGNSGVGKSSLVRMLCGKKNRGSATVGCDVEVMLYRYYYYDQTEMNTTERCVNNVKYSNYFVEFYDVSGSNNYNSMLHLFLKNIDGVIFMHDLTNYKSTTSLYNWFNMVLEKCTMNFESHHADHVENGNRHNPSVMDIYRKMDIPALVVGSKCDLNPNWVDKDSILKKLNYRLLFKTLKMNCCNDMVLNPDSAVNHAFVKFFDKVINCSTE